MNNEIKVPVKLEVLQDSITQLKSVLSSLKPESGAWKELQNILRTMTKEADALQAAMNKPFGKQSQFNAAEKGVGKIEDALERARIVMGRIKFSDIKLDDSQAATLKSFESQLDAIAQKAKNFKATLKAELQGSEQWADLLKIDPNAVTHSYDQIVKEVEKRVTKIEQESKKATEALRTAEQEGTRIDASRQFFTAKKSLSKEGMGEDFSKFFLTDKNGDTRFRSGGKAPFYEWMRSNLLITPQQYDEIKNKSVKDLQAWIKDFDIEAAIKKVDTKKSQANTQLADLTAQRAQMQALQNIIATNQGRIAKSEADLSVQTANVTGNMNNFKDGITQATRGMSTFQSGAQGVTGACSQLSYALQRSNAEWIRMDRVASTLNGMRQSVVNFMGFYQVVNLVKKAIRDAAKNIQELDSVMNKISIVTDMSTGDLWNQIDSYSQMAQTYGVSIKGAYEVSQIYYQQGLETADVMTLTNETLKLAKISGLDYAQATDYMTTAIRGFKMEMQDAARVVDVYSALAANTAVSQEELAVAMSKTASSMEGVGATFEESSAMIATMVAVTRESATNIGSAMKSIASRYGELTKDPMTLIDADGEVLAFNKVDTALQSVGISMKTADGQFRKFTDVILELSEVWNTLESTQQRYIATQFAGNRQQSRFLALVSNEDLLRENLDVAENSEDTGTVQALESLDSIESKLEQVKVAYQQFYTSVGAEDIWKSALGGLTSYINMLNGLPKLFGKIPIGAAAMIANLVDVIRNAGSFLLSGFSNVIEKMIQPDQMANSIANAVRDGVSQGFEIGAQTTQLTSIFQNLGLAEVFQAELAKIDFSGENVTEQLNTFYQNILAAAGNNQAQIQSAFSSLGQVGVAQAVGEGISNGASEATFAASALGLAVLQALQTAINAHSPSPTIIALFRTGVGEAIEIGLQTSAAAVVAAAQQLGLSVSEALKSAAERGEKITLNDFFDEKQSLQMIDFIANKQIAQFSSRAKEASQAAEKARINERQDRLPPGAGLSKSEIEYMNQTRLGMQYSLQLENAQKIRDYTQAALSGKLFNHEKVGEDGLTDTQRSELSQRQEQLDQSYSAHTEKRGYTTKARNVYDDKLQEIYKDRAAYQSENAQLQLIEASMQKELIEQRHLRWQNNIELMGPVRGSEYEATKSKVPFQPVNPEYYKKTAIEANKEEPKVQASSIYADRMYHSLFEDSQQRQNRLQEEQRIIEENRRRREEQEKQIRQEVPTELQKEKREQEVVTEEKISQPAQSAVNTEQAAVEADKINQETEALQQQAAAVNEVATAKQAMAQAQSSADVSSDVEVSNQATEALNREKEAITAVKDAEEQKTTAEQAQKPDLTIDQRIEKFQQLKEIQQQIKEGSGDIDQLKQQRKSLVNELGTSWNVDSQKKIEELAKQTPTLQNDSLNVFNMAGQQQTSESISQLLTQLQNLGTIAEADKVKLQQLFDNSSPAEFLTAYNQAIGQENNAQFSTLEKLNQDMAELHNQSANQELSFKVTADNEVLDETKKKLEEVKNSASEEVNVTITDGGTSSQTAENIKQVIDATNELNNAQANSSIQSATTTQPPVSWEDAMEMEAEGYNEQNNTNLYSSEIDSVSALSDELVKLGGMSEEAGQKLKDSLYSASPEELTQKFQELQQSIEFQTLQNDLSAVIDQLVQLGAMSEKAGQQLKNSFKEASPDELKSKIEELNTKVQDTKLNQAFQRMDSADPEVAQINARIAAEEQYQGVIQRTIGYIKQKSDEGDAVGRKYNSIGSALSTVVSIIDKSTEGGRAFAGTLTTVAGGLKVIGALMQKNPWMALATGIVTIVNGISMMIEDDTERAERLSKAAEEASNKAKEAKANQKDIEKTIKDFDILKEKRYESEEGAQKYQEAVDNITNKFPSLIAGFDSAGEVILKAGEMEQILATAREQTAAATYKAAQAEKEKVENELASKRQQLKDKVSSTDESFSEVDSDILTGDYTSTAVHTLLGYNELLGSNQNSEFIKQYARLTNNIGAEGTLFAGAQETIPSIIANFGKVLLQDIEENPVLGTFKDTLKTNGYDSFNSFLSAIVDDTVEDGYLLTDFENVINSLYKQYGFSSTEEFKEFLFAMPENPMVDPDDNIKSILSAFENKQVKSPILQDVLTLAKSYTDNSLSEEVLLSQLQPIKDAYEIFHNTINDSKSSSAEIYNAFTSYKKLLDEIQTTDPLYELLANHRQEAEEYASLIGDYDTLVAKDKAVSKQLSNAYLLKQFKTNASYRDVFDGAKGANGLVTAIGNQLALNYSSSNINTDFATYADSGDAQDFIKQSLNGAQTFLNNLNASTNTEKLKQFNQMMDNMSDYQWSDFETRFSGIGGWDDIQELVQSEYKGQTSTISERASKRIQQSKNVQSSGWKRLNNLQLNYGTFDTADETSVLNSVLTTYDRLLNAGSTEEANDYIEGMSQVLEDLNNIEDIDQRNAAFKALKGENLNTREGVIAAAAALKQIEGLDTEYSERLTNVGKTMLSNIPLALETLKDTVNTVWKDQGKEFDKLINGGIEGYEMQDVIDAAGRVGVTLTVDDFSMTDSGKMLLDYEKWNTYYNAAMTQVNDQTEDLGEILANRARTADDLTREMLKSAGIEVAEGVTDEELKSYYDQYDEKMEEFQTQYDYIKMIPTLMGRTLARSQLKKGNFTSISESLDKGEVEDDWDRLLALAGKEVEYSDKELENADIKSTVKGIQGSINSLISDIIKKGADNIDLEDYDYLPKDGSLDLLNGPLHEVVARYIKYAGLTIEEANNQIFAAFDKERSKTNTNLIRDLTFQGNGLVELTEDQFKNLVNTFEVDLSTEDGQRLIESFYNGINALTGKAAVSLQYLESYGIDLSQVDGFKDIVSQSVAGVFDKISGEVSNGVEYATAGAKNLADIESFKQSYEQITHKALADDAFGYNAVTGTFTLGQQYLQEYLNAQKEKMKNMGYSEQFVNAYIENLTDKAIQDNIELSAFLNATTNQSRNDEANKLIQQIRGLSNYKDISRFAIDSLYPKYGAGLQAGMAEIEEESFKAIITVLESGGQAAVNLLKKIKPDASSEELEAVYNNQINKLRQAREDLNKGVGETISGIAVPIAQAAGFAVTKLDDGTAVINSIGDMVAANNLLYEEMKKNNEATISDINTQYASLLTSSDQKNIDTLETLQNAYGMTYQAFADLMTKYGKNMQQVLENSAQYGKITRDGFGNLRIEDFKLFAQGMGWDLNSPEIKEAYSNWVDARAEWQNKPTEIVQNAADQLKNLSEAKPGEAVNISYLQDVLGYADWQMNNLFKQYGATVKRGLITLDSTVDIRGLIIAITNEAARAGALLPEQLAELVDTIEKMLSSITELISKGFNGELTNVEKQSVDAWAASQDLSIAWQKTASGWKIAESSIWDCYNAVNDLNIAEGEVLRTQIKQSKIEHDDRYASSQATIEHIDNLQDELKVEREIAAFRTKQQITRPLVKKGAKLDFFEGLNGNVDMYTRPWIDNADGTHSTISTLHSNLNEFSEEIGVQEIPFQALFTPIPANATKESDVWSNTKLDEYISQVLKDAQAAADEAGQKINIDFIKAADTDGMLIDIKEFSSDVEQEFNDMEIEAQQLHEWSEAWETMRRDKDEYPDNSARIAALEQELALAREINAERATSKDDSFNFMSNEIPAGQQNPLTYAKNLTQAFKAINDAYKVKNTVDRNAGGIKRTRTGYMAYEDFYNIINELNNMAAVSGKAIKIGHTIAGDAYELDGTLESASNFITEGIRTLTAVDTGDMMVNIGALGINLAKGGKDLKNGIQDGVDAIADAEIAAIDAMIAVLEVIVAMEKLKDVDVDQDMEIDLSEMFQFKGGDESDIDNAYAFTTKYDDFRNYITSKMKSDPEFKKNIEAFKINGIALSEALDMTVAELKKSGINLKAYHAAINSLYKAAISNNYDTDEIAKSLREELLNAGITDLEVNIGDYSIIIKGGNVSVVDWASAGAEDAIKKYMKDKNWNDTKDNRVTARNDLQEIMDRYTAGQTVTELELEYMLRLNSHYTIDENGKITGILWNGVAYDQNTNPEEYRKAVALNYLKDRGVLDPNKSNLEDIVINGNTAEYTVKVGNQEVTYNIEFSDKGGINKSKVKVKGQEYDSIADAQNKLFEKWFEEQKQQDPGLTDKEYSEKYTKDIYLWQHWNLITKVETEFKKGDEKIDINGPNGVSLRKELNDFKNNVQDYVISDTTGNVDVTMKSGVTFTVPGDKITYDVDENGNKTPNLDSVNNYIQQTLLGQDLSLQENITAAINEAFAKLGENFDPDKLAAAGGALQTIAGALSTIASLDLSNIDGLSEKLGLTDVFTPLTTALSTLQTILDSLSSSLFSGGVAGGEQLPAGQAEGITNNGSVAENAAEAEAEEVIDAANTGLGVDSPSIYMIEAGHYVVEGLAIGITEQSSIAEEAGQELGKSIIESIKIGLEGISECIEIINTLIEQIGQLGENTPKLQIDTTTAESQLEELKNKFSIIDTMQNITTEGGVYDIGDFTTIQYIQTQRIGGGGGGSNEEVQDRKTGITISPTATGNIGLAKSKGTLMGELGPELVVSNGHYFVAGQNGAEMVNLADDAIVFNHLQTEQLLKNGMSSGRGRAVTNERNAVAFATGNINGGPAMASASAALAALKQLRAMWEALKAAKVSDLAGGGGGGGGGGGTQNKIVDPKAWVDTVERWYNLTQEIARLEEEITHQETIRSKLQSDWQKNGNAYYRSQKKSLDSLNQQIAAQEQLNISRREYFNKRVEALKDEALGQIYTFDEEGQLQFRKDVTINGKQGGMEFLTDLYGFNNLGKANYTNKEKYDILMASGFADYMKYDSNGMEIKVGGEGTEEDYETFYEQATQAFRDRLDQYNDATQSLLDEINQGEDDIEKLETDRNELMKEIRDNQMELENEILDAIVESRQRQIDALQDQRDALEETTGKYIEGLSDALEKERDMYERQESQDELNRNKRRLAILQRSGGSAADISSLQSDISSQERDLYFDAQQAQIDAIQEASDLEIERLDKQIELMTETLEFQQEYGLLWGEVYEVMDRSSQEIVDFINGNSAEFWKMSTLAQVQAMNDETFKAEYWTSYKDDLDVMATEIREAQLARDYSIFDQRMKAEYGDNYDANGRYRQAFENEYRQGWNIDEATEVARKLYHDEVIKPQEEARRAAERAAAEAAAQVAVEQAASGGGGGGGSSSSSSSKVCRSCANGCKVNCGGNNSNTKSSDTSSSTCSTCGDSCRRTCGLNCATDCVGGSKGKNSNSSGFKQAKGRANGGYVGHGIYELGEQGTETVLTASQTRVLRNNILSNRPNSLISLLKTYNEGFNQNKYALATATLQKEDENPSIFIENASVNMNVQQISNDYDARRAGEQALNEIMRIARKSGATNSVRR